MSINASVTNGNLELKLTGISVLWAAKRSLTFPLKNVRGATYDTNAITLPKGIRSPGLHVPKIMTAGTYFKDGERQFWHVSSGKNTVVIRLKHEKYSQLLIDVTNPEELVLEINSLL